MLMLDLCCGLGGASKAMRERGWDVITVDIVPEFNPSIVADLRTFHYSGPRPDLVWASPPCQEFSRWSLPESWACNRGGKQEPDVSLMLAAMRVIEEVKPRWWIIENVRGAVPFFEPHLGPVRKRSGSRYLWGEFPPFDCEPGFGKEKLPPSRDRPALRSIIPKQLSTALCRAVELW
ncbi:MAG: DNA cytosine methyltransferase [bacterium]|jgi:hypothetical protein|nr:DNA cytosine methyltransferase [bacterium]